MRCVHCGNEVRENVVFCIHCDRPIKWEYNHYACEIYDTMSPFKQKWHKFWAGIQAPMDGELQHKKRRMTGPEPSNMGGLLGGGKERVQELYQDYQRQKASPKTSGEIKRLNQRKAGSSVREKTDSESEKQKERSLGKTIWIAILILYAIAKIFAGI